MRHGKGIEVMKIAVILKRLFLGFTLLTGLAFATAPAQTTQQSTQPATATRATASIPSTATLNTDDATTLTTGELVRLLLVNPADRDPLYKALGERRVWLAMQSGALADFEKVAGEFKSMGAYYSALELLFFADKIATDPQTRQSLSKKMQVPTHSGRTSRSPKPCKCGMPTDANRPSTALMKLPKKIPIAKRPIINWPNIT